VICCYGFFLSDKQRKFSGLPPTNQSQNKVTDVELSDFNEIPGDAEKA